MLGDPASGAAPVLVIHSWWGLTPSFHAYGAALASAGFLVGLADLFGGRTAATEAETRALRAARRSEPIYKTLTRNMVELREATGTRDGPVNVVGFSMGGHWAVWLSQRADLNVGKTVLYYAARGGDYSSSQSAYLAHFAETDRWVTRSARRRMESAIASAGRPYRAHDYPGTSHWFAESDRIDAYAASAADTAFAHSAAFLGGNPMPLAHQAAF